MYMGGREGERLSGRVSEHACVGEEVLSVLNR